MPPNSRPKAGSSSKWRRLRDTRPHPAARRHVPVLGGTETARAGRRGDAPGPPGRAPGAGCAHPADGIIARRSQAEQGQSTGVPGLPLSRHRRPGAGGYERHVRHVGNDLQQASGFPGRGRRRPSFDSDHLWTVLYLIAVTITTLGFGDITPVTEAARLKSRRPLTRTPRKRPITTTPATASAATVLATLNGLAGPEKSYWGDLCGTERCPI